MDKPRFNKQVSHEKPSQRKHYRFNSPLWLTIEEQEYQTKDWSISGLSLDSFHRPLTEGEEIDSYLTIDFQDFHINFQIKLTAMRVDENKVGFKFDESNIRHKEMLEYLSQKSITGEFVEIKGVFRHMDAPVTATSLQPDLEENTLALSQSQEPTERYLISFGYLSLGMAILLYLSSLLYSYFFNIRVESAVVTAPLTSVVALNEGAVNEIFVTEDNIVNKGTPLFKLQNAKINQELKLAELATETTKSQYEYYERLIKEEKEKLAIYRAVNNKQNNALMTEIKQLEKNTALSKAIYQRSINLTKQGVISKNELDNNHAKYLKSEIDLVDRQRKKELEDVSATALDNGYYYVSGEIQGNVKQNEAAAKKAWRAHEVELERLSAAKAYNQQLIQTAPFDGQVVEVISEKGDALKKGAAVVVLEKQDERIIDAYLTQDEILALRLNDKADVFVPAINRKIKATIISINRTQGFVDEISSQYQWRAEKDRTALVQLSIDNYASHDVKELLPAGTPLVVYFTKHSNNQFFAGLLNLFRG